MQSQCYCNNLFDKRDILHPGKAEKRDVNRLVVTVLQCVYMCIQGNKNLYRYMKIHNYKYCIHSTADVQQLSTQCTKHIQVQ